MKKCFLFVFLFFSGLFWSQEAVDLSLSVEPIAVREYSTAINEVEYEKINSFHSEINIQKDGAVTVTEYINVTATGDQIRRGIFRALPLVRNINGEKDPVSYKIISVERDNRPEDYHVKKSEGKLTVYIGSEDYFLPAGIYTYTIKYETFNQIGFFDHYDEFYWNVNGTDWNFETDSISTEITFPDDVKISQFRCYTGTQGSTAENCSGQKLSDNTIIFSAKNLREKENLTVAAGFNKGVFEKPSGLLLFMKRHWFLMLLFIPAVFLLAFYYFNWRKYGRDPEKPIVIPQFNPPRNLSAAKLGYADSESFSFSFVTATLVNLSVHDFIRIKEEKSSGSKEYKLTKLKKANGELFPDESLFLSNLFQGKDFVNLDGKYNPKLFHAVNKLQENVESTMKNFVKEEKNNKIVWKAFGIFTFFSVVAFVLASYFSNDYRFLWIGFTVFVFSFILVVILLLVWESKNRLIFIALLLFFSCFLLPLFSFAFFRSDEVPLFVSHAFKFLIFGAASLIGFKYLMRRPRDEKPVLQAEIDGFKMYLTTAEERLMKFHNPPEMTIETFEKYLPYAIAFGVEDIWGKKFEKILAASVLEPQYKDHAAFYSSGFSDAMNRSVSNGFEKPQPVSSSSSSWSGSSSSSSRSSYSGGSSSSGSSGGGSSGGGGGGGGGGGW